MSNRGIAHDQVAVQCAPLLARLDEAGVYEVCVNSPGVIWVESSNGWSQHTVTELTYARLIAIANVVASWSAQRIGPDKPMLSATLPQGQRIQVVVPPAVPEATVSVTIRKPSTARLSMADLSKGGLFAETRDAAAGMVASEDNGRLSELLAKGYVESFLSGCVRARKNIVISGATGSGKTTLSKALIEIIPLHERIITIEDTLELVVPQPNHVRLLYSKGCQGTSQVTAKQLLESALRMRPDRILVQELRDGAAWDYLRNVNSGHPGSITTVHANSCALAMEQLTLLVKESEAGRQLDRADIAGLLATLVDVVVQCRRIGGAFRVTEISFGRAYEAAPNSQ